MKKIITISILFILLIATSCRSKQILNNTTTTDSISEIKSRYSFKQFEIKSLAINDTFRFSFPKITTGATAVKDCDSLCNSKIKEALQKIKTSKNSGTNEYKVYYDKFLDQIVINTKIGETVNKFQDSITVLQKDLFIAKNTIKEVPVVQPLTKTQVFLLRSGIAFWILLVAVCGWKLFKFYKKVNPIS